MSIEDKFKALQAIWRSRSISLQEKEMLFGIVKSQAISAQISAGNQEIIQMIEETRAYCEAALPENKDKVWKKYFQQNQQNQEGVSSDENQNLGLMISSM